MIETIPDFHNTPKRYKDLLVSVAHDTIDNRAQRVIPVKDYVKAIMDKEDLLSILMDALENGVIPYRVVHNDPKLNNVLFDKATAEPICMIDLDTIMPGTSLFDVGDALRSIANTASEDDKTTDNVSFSTEIFEKFVTGYIIGSCSSFFDILLVIGTLGTKLPLTYSYPGISILKTITFFNFVNHLDKLFSFIYLFEYTIALSLIINIMKNIIKKESN